MSAKPRPMCRLHSNDIAKAWASPYWPPINGSDFNFIRISSPSDRTGPLRNYNWNLFSFQTKQHDAIIVRLNLDTKPNAKFIALYSLSLLFHADCLRHSDLFSSLLFEELSDGPVKYVWNECASIECHPVN